MGEKCNWWATVKCVFAELKILVLVEGQSEERFVKAVLAEHLFALGRFIIPKILTTKIVASSSNFKGGVTSFVQFDRDLRLLLGDSSASCVTMMIDLYALRPDFPSFVQANRQQTYDEKASFLEKALSDFYRDERFVPYFSTHEFEALTLHEAQLFVDNVPGPHDFEALKSLCDVENPESINSISPPAKRIVSAAPRYRKTLHGTVITERIGINTIRRRCPRFAAWLHRLETL